MLRRGTILLCLSLCITLSAAAQMMGPRPPALRGIWAPEVGSGAAYAVDSQGEKRNMEVAIVGKDTAQGKPAHWLEMYFNDPRMGEMVMKTLVVVDGENTRPVRMIFQNPQMGAMEMPMEMVNRGGRMRNENQADISKTAQLVGTEEVTTPAGTFTCDHYRSKEGDADVWVAKNIGPWGLVKMTSKDANMTLTKVITNAKTRITGTPQMFDPAAMMRDRP